MPRPRLLDTLKPSQVRLIADLIGARVPARVIAREVGVSLRSIRYLLARSATK